MTPTQSALDRLMRALRLTNPPIAIYDTSDVAAFAPTVEAQGRTCCYAYYNQWMKGTTLVIRKCDDVENPRNGCPGAQRSFGLTTKQAPWLASFIADGANAPAGEGLKASAQLAQQCLDGSPRVSLTGNTVLIGPLRLAQWNAVRAVTLFVDADRLAALTALAAYWSSDPELAFAPFSSGCGLMWRELEGQTRPRAVVGCGDVTVRQHLPPEIMSFAVLPAHFAQMLKFPDEAFLNKPRWNSLMEQRARQTPPA
jgi:hypothetical protein